MEETFVSGSDPRLNIIVKFEDPFITFTFENGSCFYDFYIEDWQAISMNFSQKSWATSGMINFINKHAL